MTKVNGLNSKVKGTDSALKTFRTCRKKYYWRYIRELVPIRSSVPLRWGNLGHELISVLYKLNMNNDVDQILIDKAKDWRTEQIKKAVEIQSANNLFNLETDLVQTTEDEADNLCNEVVGVVLHYALTQWKEDLYEYCVQFNEQTFNVPLPDSLDRRHSIYEWSGKWDLVLAKRETLDAFLVDHKFTSRHCETLASELESDTQPVSYLYAYDFLTYCPNHLRQETDSPSVKLGDLYQARGFIHNIIRRQKPSEPPLLKNRKNPTLSRSKELVTTEALYWQAIKRYNLNPADYEDVLNRLSTSPQIFNLRNSPSIDTTEVEEWLRDTKQAMREMATIDRKPDLAYRNPDACRILGRRCQYIPLCWQDFESAKSGFTHEPRHVELEDDETASEQSWG